MCTFGWIPLWKEGRGCCGSGRAPGRGSCVLPPIPPAVCRVVCRVLRVVSCRVACGTSGGDPVGHAGVPFHRADGRCVGLPLDPHARVLRGPISCVEQLHGTPTRRAHNSQLSSSHQHMCVLRCVLRCVSCRAVPLTGHAKDLVVVRIPLGAEHQIFGHLLAPTSVNNKKINRNNS